MYQCTLPIPTDALVWVCGSMIGNYYSIKLCGVQLTLGIRYLPTTTYSNRYPILTIQDRPTSIAYTCRVTQASPFLPDLRYHVTIGGVNSASDARLATSASRDPQGCPTARTASACRCNHALWGEIFALESQPYANVMEHADTAEAEEGGFACVTAWMAWEGSMAKFNGWPGVG